METIVTGATQDEGDDDDRLKDVSQLSAAVGHFLINAFSAVVSNAELIRSRASATTEAAPLDSLGSAIVKTAIDASKVARRLIDWTRLLSGDADNGSEASSVDINQLIRETVDSRRIESSSRMEWVLNLAAIPTIVGDPVRLRSMLNHLIRNALEAQPDGSVTVAFSTHTDPRGWAVIEVTDAGCGMSPEILRRATEPFFSTKPDHEGVGLTIAQTIWRRHRGSLSIDSQPGQGTTIRLVVGPAPAPRPVQPPSLAPAVEPT